MKQPLTLNNINSTSPAVLFLSSWYPIQQNPVHGIFIQQHAQALSNFTPVIAIYACSVNHLQNEELEITENQNFTEIKLLYPKTSIKIPVIKQIVQFFKYKKAYKKLLALLIEKKIKVKAIQVNVVFPVSIVFPLFTNYYKVKYTIAEHWSGYLPEDGAYNSMFIKHFTQKCFKHADKIWYVSEKLKQALVSHKLTGNFEQLYNVVNTTIFSRKEVAKFKKPTFLHVSSLVEREKNLQGTFQALKELQNKGFDFDLIIAGGNSNSIETLKDFQKTIDLNNVTYKGIQNKNSISHLMNQSHALLLFSHFEGMPVVALEALACGLPVLASSVGALPQIIQEDFGKLVSKNDVNQISELLENFLLNKFSFNENKMQAFIKNNASLEMVGKKMYDFYKAC